MKDATTDALSTKATTCHLPASAESPAVLIRKAFWNSSANEPNLSDTAQFVPDAHVLDLPAATASLELSCIRAALVLQEAAAVGDLSE